MEEAAEQIGAVNSGLLELITNWGNAEKLKPFTVSYTVEKVETDATEEDPTKTTDPPKGTDPTGKSTEPKYKPGEQAISYRDMGAPEKVTVLSYNQKTGRYEVENEKGIKASVYAEDLEDVPIHITKPHIDITPYLPTSYTFNSKARDDASWWSNYDKNGKYLSASYHTDGDYLINGVSSEPVKLSDTGKESYLF
jgi:hypothetical protein